MLQFIFLLAFTTLAAAQEAVYAPNFHRGAYRLCTYKEVDHEKCLHTVEEAKKNVINLELECVHKNNRSECIEAVRYGSSDLTVLTGHGYREARRERLRPILFAREDNSSLSIAVVPRSITLVDLQEAPIQLNQSNHRAFHAAAYFNLRRGHDICGFMKTSLMPYIRIEDSARYQPQEDEILVCSNLLTAEFEDYQRCNVEAGLQRAIFARQHLHRSDTHRIQQIFQTILEEFNSQSERFNFFGSFSESDNVIFKNNTIGFDLRPTYRNGVNERVFNSLHCNDEHQPHDPRVLE
ncbi:transferrin [Musca domestica]|uniref:Transferrin-like n=1 Tax=Musca domestica TaxID=7370 RepID=A0A1I8MGX3_MUSDO|nr:transferrin [Musca domestica]